MRHGISFLIGLWLTIITARADEFLPTLKAGNIIYTNVTVISVTAKNISFTCAQGMASIGQDNKVPASADPKALMDLASARVKDIVNQPVRTLSASSVAGNIKTYNEWFHAGANKPDFDTVDVRKSQDVGEYSKYDYITSLLNPGVVFPGREVEFNGATKYFYTDRSLPKKKLTEAEMLEVNRLYRIIGQCEARLGMPKDHGAQVDAAADYLSKNRTMIIEIAAGLLVLLVIIRMVTKRA
jgi:hypothetical protein